ncbi:hypothetical protein [Thetidibacter halocola]|uniref:Uncharacterized protein n=1 Tax=Thetidibacter halocola TaxID=2827239 RepID=A0A8J7WFZ1_9RHOB|nr:hypothetical protein [Thetidibacter halocola]MBS0125001.1 hypothetical protein [Thetidibacter halocola]
MSNSLLLNGPTGFNFKRPTIGRIGATDQLHPYVEAAIDAMTARLRTGFPAPEPRASERVEELEALAAEKDRDAREAQSESDRGARLIDEAYEEHAKAEDYAERKTAEHDEALRQVEDKTRDEEPKQTGATARSAKTAGAGAQTAAPDLKTLKAERDKARAAADRALETLETVKSQAAGYTEKAREANRLAKEAGRHAAEARRRLTRAKDAVAEILGLPIFSRDPQVRTLLSTPSSPGDVDLRQLIDRYGYTAEFYAVRRLLAKNASRLSFNLRNLLAEEEVVEYLFARVLLVEGIDESEGIFNAIVDEDRGGELMYRFASEYALTRLRNEKRLAIPEAVLGAMVARLHEEPVLLRRDPFDSTLNMLAAEFVYGDAELALILKAEQVLGINIPAKLQPALVDYIRRTNEDITVINDQNAPYFISIALSKLQKEDVALRPAAYGDTVGVEDYSVSYYEDRITAPEYERASVEAAAQMYLTMVWGDMLGVFPAVDRIAMQSAGDGQAPILLEVRSRELSDDLRMYVLDEEFRDLKTGRVSRRVAPAERQMFYRQLFGLGDAPVVEDQHVNPDFQRYWAVLMMETVKYIGKVEENGDNYSSISASKVYQAIEDLQYNLSAYCTGLPKIAAPTMYAELDFVIRRILDSDDVKQQLGRRGSQSFWKVIEQVRGMQDFTPLRNKGMYGHKILSTVARATPALVEDQSAFEDFIASVEAFILAEDQLAEAGGSMASLQFPGFFGFDSPGMGGFPGMNGGYPGMPAGGFPGMPAGLPGMPNGMFGSPSGSGMQDATRSSNGARSPTDDWNF